VHGLDVRLLGDERAEVGPASGRSSVSVCVASRDSSDAPSGDTRACTTSAAATISCACPRGATCVFSESETTTSSGGGSGSAASPTTLRSTAARSAHAAGETKSPAPRLGWHAPYATTPLGSSTSRSKAQCETGAGWFLTPTRRSQHGPSRRRLSRKSSVEDALAPKTREKVAPAQSAGSAGNVAE
jgi:hypothetical protein